MHETNGHQPEPGAQSPREGTRIKPNLHVEIQTYLWPKKMIHMCSFHYLHISLFSDKTVLQVNPIQESPFLALFGKKCPENFGEL